MSGRRGVTATDRLMLAYLVLSTAVVVWRAPHVGEWPWLLAGNLLALVLLPLLSRASTERALPRLVGGAYPLILALAFYWQLGILTLDAGTVRDALVQRWDQALFGSQVSITWHQRQPSLVLSWVLHACYFSYYGLLLVPLLALFWRGSRDAYERGGFMVALAFYTCYAVFAFFPVAGPRFMFGTATGPEARVLPARLVHAVLESGSAYGTAFPSSHVAAAWCAVLALWRELRKWALALAPIALGLALGTVYGQFHYGVDALAGALAGLALFAAADPLRRALGSGYSTSA